VCRLAAILGDPDTDIDALAVFFDDLLRRAVEGLNAEFSPNRLCKATRDVEPLPIAKRSLSSYRTRIGTTLEYALSTEMDRLLGIECGDAYHITFVWWNTYPDFIVRDRNMTPLVRIEMKAVDAYSVELAASFDAPTHEIKPEIDLVGLVGWHEAPMECDGVVVGERPHVFASTVVPAAALSHERDINLVMRKGVIQDGIVYVVSTKTGKLTKDPGNYGKIRRIVHLSRRDADDLSPGIRRYQEFIQKVLAHTLAHTEATDDITEAE